MANILVTGGAGYIGSHTCKALKKIGHTPVSLDNLSRGFKKSVRWGPLIETSIHDFNRVKQTLVDYNIQAVIHFAAFAYVGESTRAPTMYFENNVKGSLLLFEAMKDAGVKKLVFSSSCATYGESDGTPISEDHPQLPTNPYGLSKLMVEKMLTKYSTTGDLKFCALRYFNAAGADPEGETGENHEPEPHILPNIIKAGLHRSPLQLFGNDYPTPDGTCIRDFVHVSDLAQAHVLALEKLLSGKTMAPFYNLANTQGYSLLELVQACEKYLDKSISYTFTPRRPGDPAQLIGSAKSFKTDFSWETKHSHLETILKTAIAWEKLKPTNI